MTTNNMKNEIKNNLCSAFVCLQMKKWNYMREVVMRQGSFLLYSRLPWASSDWNLIHLLMWNEFGGGQALLHINLSWAFMSLTLLLRSACLMAVSAEMPFWFLAPGLCSHCKVCLRLYGLVKVHPTRLLPIFTTWIHYRAPLLAQFT